MPDRERIRQESDAVTKALLDALDSRGPGPVQGEAGKSWTAAQVLSHLSRWQRVSLDALRRHLAGERPRTEHEDENVLNDRWVAEDVALVYEEAKARYTASREELLVATLAVPDSSWDIVVETLATDDTTVHVRAHLAAITSHGS